MDALRTPDERFDDIADYPFAPNYSTVGTGLRMHHLDEGDGPPILLMHGEPSWSYLYRKMIGPLVEAGHRAVAPDLIGFGKSDKPAAMDDYSYARHVEWTEEWFLGLDLSDITLFCQDWGGLIGLRLVAAHPDRFRGVVVANTGFPTGEHQATEAFFTWQEWSRTAPLFEAGWIVNSGTVTDLAEDTVAAYNAPFPDDSFKAGARIFPSLVPSSPDDPERAAQEAAWRSLMRFEKPFVTAFGDSDPITRGGERPFQKLVPGAQGMPHRTVEGGGHFIQEDQPDALVAAILDVVRLGGS